MWTSSPSKRDEVHLAAVGPDERREDLAANLRNLLLSRVWPPSTSLLRYMPASGCGKRCPWQEARAPRSTCAGRPVLFVELSRVPGAATSHREAKWRDTVSGFCSRSSTCRGARPSSGGASTATSPSKTRSSRGSTPASWSTTTAARSRTWAAATASASTACRSAAPRRCRTATACASARRTSSSAASTRGQGALEDHGRPAALRQVPPPVPARDGLVPQLRGHRADRRGDAQRQLRHREPDRVERPAPRRGAGAGAVARACGRRRAHRAARDRAGRGARRRPAARSMPRRSRRSRCRPSATTLGDATTPRGSSGCSTSTGAPTGCRPSRSSTAGRGGDRARRRGPGRARRRCSRTSERPRRRSDVAGLARLEAAAQPPRAGCRRACRSRGRQPPIAGRPSSRALAGRKRASALREPRSLSVSGSRQQRA